MHKSPDTSSHIISLVCLLTLYHSLQLSEFSVDGSIIIDGPVRSNSLHVISGGSRWALRCRFDHRQHREAGLVRRAVCDTRMRSMLVVSVV
jgi:hypothetical protein